MQKLIAMLRETSWCSFSVGSNSIHGWLHGEAFEATLVGEQIRFEYDRLNHPLMIVEAPEEVVLTVVKAITKE